MSDDLIVKICLFLMAYAILCLLSAIYRFYENRPRKTVGQIALEIRDKANKERKGK